MSRYDKRDILIIAGLLALCLLFFWRFFTPAEADQVMFPQGDFSYQFYAWRAMIFRALRAGQLPLWTDNLYAGYPLQADPQSAMFYPLSMLVNLIALVAGAEVFPFRLLEWEAIAHVFLTSVFLYAFLRLQTRRRLSALLGSIVFSYGGYLTSYPLLQMAIVEGATWLPLGLLGIWLCYKERRPRALFLTALALGMSILAGHPQTSMLVLYCLLAYQVYHIWRSGAPWYIGLRDIILTLIVAAGLSAIQSLPSWQYTRLSTRADLAVSQAGSGFPLMDVVQLLLTGLVSLWHPLYIGVLPLALVVISLVCPKPTRRAARDIWFWLGVAIVALLLSFGQKLFSFELAYLFLPSYDLFRGQERLAMLVSLGLAILAAYGADTLWSALAKPQRQRVQALTCWLGRGALGSLALLFIVAWLHRQGIDPSDSGDLPTHMGILALMMASSWALLHGRLSAGRRRAWWEGLGLALVVLNLFSLNRALNQVPVQQVYPVSPPIQIMQEDESLFRFQDDHRLPPQSACVHDLEQIWGISPIRPASYQTFMDEAPEAIRWQLLNVKYVISWRGSLTTREGIQIPANTLYRQGDGEDVLYVYRLREPGPRAWIVHGTYFARDDHELYEYMQDPTFDPSRAAVLSTPLILPTIDADYQDKVTILSHEPMRIRLQADLEAEGLLVLSELYYPGWQAYVNGDATPILQANGTLRAVVLPTGASEVEFRYQPMAFYIGATLSAIVWLLLFGMVIKGLARQNTKRGQNAAS